MLRRGASIRRPNESSSGTANGLPHNSSISTSSADQDVTEMNNGPATQRRLDRTQSTKARTGHGHHRSQSRQQEQKSVGEYALHHLFNKFVVQADHKIDQCVQGTQDKSGSLERYCGAGADPDFDQLISALAHINRQKPKPLVDTIMYWRKAKGDQALEAKKKLSDSRLPNAGSRGLSRRITEPSHVLYPGSSRTNSGEDDPNYSSSPSLADVATQTEQRSQVSIYLLCRVLIEVYNQTDVVRLNRSLAEKIEDIIFVQLKNTEPDHFQYYPFRAVNWKIFSQLLGVMSSTNLQSVSQRFVTELRSCHSELGAKGVATSQLERRVELLILAMQHLHVKTQPDGQWKESCDLLFSLGEFFANSHGAQIKHAYCQTLEDLVMPVAASWGPQVSTQRFKDFLNTVNVRVSPMITKPRHWSEAFRLSTVVLCASPTEYFATQWLSVATSLQGKLKDRTSRECALQGICRLVWSYLERVTESSNSILRKLDDVMKVVLPSGKKSYLSNDPSFSEPIIELIRIIGYHQQEFCFRTIISPLISSDLFNSGKETKVEQLEPEKMVIGIRAFLAIMSDLEKVEHSRPPFPRFNGGGLAMDSRTVPGVLHGSQPSGGAEQTPDFEKDQLSRPINLSKLGDSTREFFSRFCEIIGKITVICDNAFGGQVVLDEKFGGLTPKTPLTESFTFGRRDEHVGLAEHRQGFYDLFHVAVQALPRCLSAHVQLNALINLLCTGTAHVQTNIAVSSTQSLKSIARQALAQPVTIGFARFIFNFDARYSTMSDEGMLGPGHIENTLRLYVELLQIWIEEIKRKTKDVATESVGDGSSGNRSIQLDLTSVSALVEEVESHGIFFLCSQSRKVRSFAVKVLKIVTEFDTALGKGTPRIIHILEGDSQRVMSINDEQLTVAERSRLQKGKRKSIAQNTLIELCGSDVSYDATLWLKLFPNIIRLSFEVCPFAVTLGREIVCARLLQMHERITWLGSDIRAPFTPSSDHGPTRMMNKLGATPPEIIIEQWKFYLVMACTTMTNAGAQTQSQLDKTQHARKISKGIHQNQEKLSSARALFACIIPLLSAGQSSIRDAIVIALGSININLYRTLLESLQYAVTTCKEEAKQRIGTHQRTGSSPRRNPSTDRLRTEVTQVYRLTARFLNEPAVLRDEWIINNLCTYTKDLMIFLNDAEIQTDWECQKLRRQYCGLLEELFNGVNRTTNPSHYMSFESRKSAFALMEDWCGYSPNQSRINQREDFMRQSILEQHKEGGEKTNVTATMEIEKRNLRTAALSAMAALCAGPIRVRTDRGENLSFDVRRMLSWIDQIFATPSDKMHSIGRRALHNLIIHNREFSYLLEHSIERCYIADPPRALESHFDVVTKVLLEQVDYPVAFWRILGAVIFTLGNEKSEIRMKSAKLLRLFEQRQQKGSNIQDFDISVSDRTTAVYKRAQFEISKKLAAQYRELASFIFSQFSVHFKNIHPDSQRNMVAAILPWIQVIELQVDPTGGPTAQSYMVLANLLEITTKASGALHNEIQALWQALATGHPGNVQLVLDFVISLCLDRREQSFVDYAKQIIVHLSSTLAGQKVVEFLLQQINPRNMVQKKREPIVLPPDNLGLPYVADLSEALPIGNKQSGFSLGQLALIFLVDLMVSPVRLSKEYVPLLLQVIFVLWDHYTLLVQEQAREMLVHLIHELVVTKIDDNSTIPNKSTIEAFVDSIRQHEPSVVWTYEEWNGKDEADDSNRIPASMTYVTAQVVDLFAIAYPQIREQWAKMTLSWATSCPVRHIACRSFQVFRCILSTFDRPMLADILARLSNTIADKVYDVQIFSLEILTTLKAIIEALEPTDLLQYPQLFWATCACLDTVYEREFIEILGMLEKLLAKVNLSDPAVVKILEKAKPEKWQGAFEGITPHVYKGLKSDASLEKSLQLLDQVMPLPDNELVGTETRLLFGTLANLPRFLHSFDDPTRKNECIGAAQILASVADYQENREISQVLNAFANRRYATSREFLSQILVQLRRTYFPTWELKTLIFLIGLLTNRLHWYKVRTLDVLQAIIQDVDTRRTEIASHGPDLISPLLRLLQTQYCSQALEVMDHIMTMSETPMSKHHLRMSLVGSASRATRKEYDKTQSLYGIPEETGWSIPTPAVHSNSTRANMQVVYLACIQTDCAAAETVPTPEIEFHADEETPGSSFPIERSDTISSEDIPIDTSMEGGMGDLLTKLNSLGDFFEDSLDEENSTSNRYSTLTITPYSHNVENGADIYDQQTAPILYKSLACTASVTSLHNGLPDPRVASSSRDPGIMTPNAFNPPPTTLFPSNAPAPSRPTLHSRSVTSPANNLATKSSTNVSELLSDEEADETFSEDERSTGYGSRMLGGSSVRSAHSSIRKMAPGLEKRDYRQRGLLRAQSRGQSQAPGSPRVPKVPEEYLQQQGVRPSDTF